MATRLNAAMMSAAAMVAAVAVIAPAQAAYLETNHQFISNGGFETTSGGSGGVGQIGYNGLVVSGWTSLQTNGQTSGGDPGYNFIMSGSTATAGNVQGQYGSIAMWGPSNGSNNGFRADPYGTGGNFIAADGGFQQGKIVQQLTGLIVGETYHLSFDWAAAQQYGYDGATTESWIYGMSSGALAGQTATVNNANHGFVDWRSQSYDFVATSATDTLYFLAKGAPAGQPPFSLLDNVSVTGAYGQVVSTAPEPGTWAMFLLGFGLVGFIARHRRSQPASGARQAHS